MISKDSHWVSRKLNKGLDFHRRGLLEQAKDIYFEIIKIDKKNFDALQLLGALELEKNQYESALKFLTMALDQNKLNTNTYYNLGMVLHKLNQLEEARGAYDKAIELNENFYDAYTNKGNVLKDLGDIELAINCYEKAISINPNEFNGLQLMQVAIDSANIAETIYSANSNVPNSGYQLKKLLSAPVQMKSTFDITFPDCIAPSLNNFVI
jgi:tetratricopeptide (TPR) repeat protein